MVAALNFLDLQAADIENSYLTAPCSENIWTRARPQFGIGKGNVYIVVRALYGLKSSGAEFRAFLAERLDEMDFKSSVVGPGVWYREDMKSDCGKYYKYILVYVYDFFLISLDSRSIILEVAEKIKLKKDKIEPPKVYIGEKLAKKSLNVQEMWTMAIVDNVKAIINNIEVRFKKEVMKLPV